MSVLGTLGGSNDYRVLGGAYEGQFVSTDAAERDSMRFLLRGRYADGLVRPSGPKTTDYSTVTLFARLRGLSIDRPSFAAVW